MMLGIKWTNNLEVTMATTIKVNGVDRTVDVDSGSCPCTKLYLARRLQMIVAEFMGRSVYRGRPRAVRN